MKRSSVVFSGLLLLLTACGGGTTSADCPQEFWNGTLGVCVPEDWAIIDNTILEQRGIEVPDEVIVAFESKVAASGQFPRATITSENLARDISAAEFSDMGIRSIVGVTGYEELDTRLVEVAGQQVKLHVYTAQPDEGKPKQRFYQLSTVSNGVGYAVIAMAPLSIDRNTERDILLILQSLTFAEEAETSSAEAE